MDKGKIAKPELEERKIIRLKAITHPLPLAQMAYQILHESIINGHLRPREVFNEMVLAKELGISRTPVREALLKLSEQGLVTFLPRKGLLVTNFKRKDVEEIFELRNVVELFAIEKITKSEPPCDLSNLNRCLDDQRKASIKNDFTAFMKADRQFHAEFCHLANNQRIVAILENVRDLVHFLGMQGLSVKGRAEVVIKEHEEIIEAVEHRNSAKAKKAMESHLDMSEKAVLHLFSAGVAAIEAD